MTDLKCPSCGEADRIMGTPRGDLIHLFCRSCGKGWDRDPRQRCAYCDSYDLSSTPIPMMSKGRGTMQTPAGERESYRCETCGAADATRKKA